MNIRDIIRILRPLRNRMHFNTGLVCFLACLCAGGVVTTVLAYASLCIPIPHLLRSILYIYMAFAAAGMLISVFFRPGTKGLIETADALGLKERLTTAWQLQREDNVIAQLQRRDTFKMVSATDFKRLYPIRFPVKLVIVLAASLIFTSLSFIVPSYAKETAEQIEKLQDVVNEQLEEIKKVNKELKDSEALKDTELERITEEVTRLTEELKKARTEEEALKAVSRVENELEKLDIQEQMNKLGETLSRNDMTSSLGDAVQNGNTADMKQALEQLMQQLEQKEISAGELSEILKQASEQVENKEAEEQLQQTAEELASDSLEAQTGALDNLGDVLSEMMQSDGSAGMEQALGQLSQAMQQAKSSISQVNSNLSASSQNSPGASGQSSGQGAGQQAMQGNGQGSGSTSQPGQAAGTGTASEASQSQGEGQGAGQTAGKGQGAGQGAGQLQNGGGGAGEGSTNEDFGYTGSEQSGGGRKAGEGKEEEFEQLYDPDYLGGDADPSYVSGQKQDAGHSSYSQADQIPVQKGAILPYHDVLSRYSGDAASYMEETEIPAAMKEIVREYFESLE